MEGAAEHVTTTNDEATLFTLVRSEADSRERCNSADVHTFFLSVGALPLAHPPEHTYNLRPVRDGALSKREGSARETP